ncbi:dnaJ homolog subfamily C member 12-like isoform X2 [Varroa jacobsoni]|uniref:J domain-containing protein n=1 Tax=Varroa destructor TaxID=109461 RepID=A0A7M7KWV1_VARDE|nr:dnaJ homolog subfamily C member 12-like isoform X2 [Varroa destructor]XP_022697616.1 dnaJ homolog subfamily C member 12-like isoform X2 [Varroa jacobsoni]
MPVEERRGHIEIEVKDSFKRSCVDERSCEEEQIQAEYKQRALELHPDKQHQDPTSKRHTLEAFQRLQEAREVLLDHDLRTKYDRWRKSGLAIPFKQYANIKSTSLHWVTKANKELSVTDGSIASLSKSDDMDYAAKMGPASGRRQTLTGGETSLKSWRAQGGTTSGSGARANNSADELLRKFRNYEI